MGELRKICKLAFKRTLALLYDFTPFLQEKITDYDEYSLKQCPTMSQTSGKPAPKPGKPAHRVHVEQSISTMFARLARTWRAGGDLKPQ